MVFLTLSSFCIYLAVYLSHYAIHCDKCEDNRFVVGLALGHLITVSRLDRFGYFTVCESQVGFSIRKCFGLLCDLFAFLSLSIYISIPLTLAHYLSRCSHWPFSDHEAGSISKKSLCESVLPSLLIESMLYCCRSLFCKRIRFIRFVLTYYNTHTSHSRCVCQSLFSAGLCFFFSHTYSISFDLVHFPNIERIHKHVDIIDTYMICVCIYLLE